MTNIMLDSRSDFILSPHFDAIFRENSTSLIEQTATQLRSGNYNPRLPITFSVPKNNFLTRPGSILEPQDRLVHQALLEQTLSTIEEQLDRSRTFSHVPSNNTDSFFEPSHLGWDNYQASVRSICNDYGYVVRADIANYFDTIPQHALVNLLTASGVRSEIVRLLEEQLLAFKERSSVGIVQGIFPSDVWGNFYLSDFDADCDLNEIRSARYVDDIFIGFNSEIDARRQLVRMIERLRRSGLSFNSQKTKVCEANEILRDEQEVDILFDHAREAIQDEIQMLRANGYGFQGDWINSEDTSQLPSLNQIDLTAVRTLMHSENFDSDLREKIDRFCLPILRGADEDSAVQYVLGSFVQRPQLTRIYASYLTHFTASNTDIVRAISDLICADEFFCDYQRMYMIASILGSSNAPQQTVHKCLQWMQSNTIGIETRALCAIFAAKFGSAQQKRVVRLQYQNEPSEYVRSAILYSAQYFPTAEKRSAKLAWGAQSTINSWISDII